jgi:excinuclease UvrABC ATPase subunit
MLKIKLSCGHTIECESPDKAICEKCTARRLSETEKQVDDNTTPEYMKIINEITDEFKKMNSKIKREIHQDEKGDFSCRFIEPPKLLMKLFHSEGKYTFEIQKITKQPLQELKNILENVKSKADKAKEFRNIFGKSGLHFITDELFSNIYFDGKSFNYDIQCTQKRQWSYAGIIVAIVGGIVGLFIGL